MSVESVQGNIQPSEQYTIRAKREAQSANQIQESQQAIQSQNLQNETKAAEIDTYDKDNPAGVKAEGVYSVSHDESGNLKVDYTPKSESTEGTQASAKSQAGSKPESSAGAGTVSAASSTSSDDELEQLEQQKNEIQQQLNRESDENVKAQLRTQLQNIEAQIIQLKLN
ncbi:MAG: hypothetical protein IJL18_03490 [Synergistaceae bacterium]|nr:hypothetical protein [Synergistaceae bacterium]